MHKSRLSTIVIDCNTTDVDAAAAFWSAVYGWPVLPPDPGSPTYRQFRTPPNQPTVLVQAVSHPSRVHIDIETDDQQAEVARLEKLGARRVQHVKRWWVMEAPTGQRFCVVNPQRPDFAAEAHAWRDANDGPPAASGRADDPTSALQPGADFADAVLWRRVDTPGHDAGRLLRRVDGWRIEGAASFLHDGDVASLEYRVVCDGEWLTRDARVHGWIGARRLDLRIGKDSGTWTLNGHPMPGLDDCVDVDLAFTPATNLLPVRRLALEPGQAADVPAAWLDVRTGTLERLSQRYERRGESTYRYQAPRFDFDAELSVRTSGFAERYGNLWVAQQ